jgi:hypothetical protein
MNLPLERHAAGCANLAKCWTCGLSLVDTPHYIWWGETSTTTEYYCIPCGEARLTFVALQ